MRIVKPPKKDLRKTALKGCFKCPFCENELNNKRTGKYIPPIKYIDAKGVTMKVSCFHCNSCGAEWESDRYV